MYCDSEVSAWSAPVYVQGREMKAKREEHTQVCAMPTKAIPMPAARVVHPARPKGILD